MVSKAEKFQSGWMDRLMVWSVLFYLAAGMGLIVLFPGSFLGISGDIPPMLIVHLFTLGGILGGYYYLSNRIWRRIYGREPAGRWVTPLVWIFQNSGLVVMTWGTFTVSPLLKYIGGHYLVPTAIVLAVLQGIVTAFKREEGRDLHLAAHLPGMGLLVTMSLGSLMVMDSLTGNYGIYTPSTVLVHLLSGGFLFFMPLILLAQGAESSSEDSTSTPKALFSSTAPFSSTASVLFPVGMASLGVMAVSLAHIEEGWSLGFPLGLILLGGVGLWLGLPAGFSRQGLSLQSVRRTSWAAVGLLVLYAGIRVWRGLGVDEGQELARFGITLFMLVLALPEIQISLESIFSAPEKGASDGEKMKQALMFAILLLAAGMLVVAQLGGVSFLVRTGGLIWLAVLGWQALRMARS